MARSRSEGEPEDEKQTGENSEPSSRRDSLNAVEGSDDSDEELQPGAEEKPHPVAEIEESDVTCPVTGYIFLEAYTIFPMGVSLEREVAEHLLRNHFSYPQLNGEPKITAIAPARPVNALVERYLRVHPSEKSKQYVNGTYQFPAPPVQAAPEAKIDDPLPEDNWGVEGGANPPPVVADPASRVYLPIGVAIIKSSISPDAAPVKSSRFLWGETEFKKGFLNAVDRVDNQFMTIGVDFRKINLGGDQYNLSDSAGQERFRTMSPCLFRNTNFALIFSGNADWMSSQQIANLEIFKIEYDLGQKDAKLVQENNIHKLMDAVPEQVPAADAKIIIQKLLPKITYINKLHPDAPVPPANQAPAKPSLFRGLMNAIRGDKKDDDASRRRGPGQGNV